MASDEARSEGDDARVRTIGKSRNISITGCLIAWRDGQPLCVMIPDFADQCLPIFTTEENLRRSMREIGAMFDSIKTISDGPEFLDSVPEVIPVVLDPHLKDGRTRWTLIMRPCN